MLEMIATSFFFAYCISNFECWFYCDKALHTAITDAVYCVKLVVYDRRVANKLRKGLDEALHKSYNTTPAEGKHESVFCSLLLDFTDHMFIIFFCPADHIVLFDICGALWYNSYGSIRRTDFERCIKAFALMSCEASFCFFSALLYIKMMTTWLSFGARIWPHSWP